jgi:hypothetical protein
MRKYENQSKQKFGKNACPDLGNRRSIHLSYGSVFNHTATKLTPAGQLSSSKSE